LKFSGLLGDFDELVGMVNSHMAGLPGPQHDSVAKIRDRATRQRDERGAAWITYIGLFIVAVDTASWQRRALRGHWRLRP
jgi:hypothetical protein